MQRALGWLNHTAVKQLIFLVGIAFSVAAGIILFMAVRDPVWVPLDYQINDRNIANVTKILSSENIPFRVDEQRGTLLVGDRYVDKAKMRLASAGVARDDSAGYSFLDEKNGFSDVRFLDNARYIRAMESDLAKTLMRIRGISGAKVHIAIPEENIFTDENRKVTASVVLEVDGGFSGDSDRVHSVMQIVADSVPGLDPNNVSVTNQYGHLLSINSGNSQIYSSGQLRYQNNIQSYYEKRIMDLIVPIVGENRVNVRVNAEIDFTRQEHAEESYDPDKKVILSEKQSSEDRGSAGGASGAPGSLSNTPDNSAVAKEASSSAGGSGGGRKESTINYDVSKTYTWKKTDFAKISSLSVAVVLDDQMIKDPKSGKMSSKPLNKETTDKIDGLVKAAIGFNQARGDRVTVVNSQFAPPRKDLAVEAQKIWESPWFWGLVKTVSGIIFGFILLIVLIKNVSKAGASAAASMSGGNGGNNALVSLAQIRQFREEGMLRVKQLASEDPDKVAEILKSWIER